MPPTPITYHIPSCVQDAPERVNIQTAPLPCVFHGTISNVTHTVNDCTSTYYTNTTVQQHLHADADTSTRKQKVSGRI